MTEASRSPQGQEISLSDQLLQCLREAARIGVADISEQYKEGLTKQIALLHLDLEEKDKEIQALREENLRLRGDVHPIG